MKRLFSSLVLVNLVIFSLFCSPFSSSALDLGHSENTPLYFGNPSDAAPDITEENNYLMEKSGFTLSYNNYALGPNWVAWHLSINDLGDADRSNKFKADKELPEGWYGVKQNDYKFSAYGFDRGHICPSADRTTTPESNQQTFLMTNMLPQAPDCNRIVWKALEDYERKLAQAGNELYIFAGGIGRGGTGNRGYFEVIPVEEAGVYHSGDRDNWEENLNYGDWGTQGDRDNWSDGWNYDDFETQGDSSLERGILVPEFCWKIILVLPEGEDDLNRISADTQIIAVCIPNAQGCGATGSWEQYECSVDYLEEITGYDFFELIDDEIEDVIER